MARLTVTVLASLALAGCDFTFDSHVGDDPSEQSVIDDVETWFENHAGRPVGEISGCTVALRTPSNRRYICSFVDAGHVTECSVEMGTSGPNIEDGGTLRVDEIWGCELVS